MKIGRNATCPCGSGKKYKKCCLTQDEEAQRAAMAVTTLEDLPPEPPTPRPVPVPKPPRPIDPHLDALERRWEAFQAENYEGRIALFTETLDDPELMDDEMAFGMLNAIQPETIKHDQRDRFDGLVAALRERLPDIYASGAKYFLDYVITNALVNGNVDALPALLRELVLTAEFDIDIFCRVIDELAYHGHLNVLIDATRLAWHSVQHSDEVTPWGLAEYRQQAIEFVLIAYAQASLSATLEEPTSEESAVIERLQDYQGYDAESMKHFLSYLSGQADRSWTMDDFAFQPKPPPLASSCSPSDPARQNLYYLSVEFLGYLCREEGVSPSKGVLARQQLYQYILQRFDQRLEPMPSRLHANSRSRRQTRRSKAKRRLPFHLLCPDQETFDRFLGALLHFFNPQVYKAAATFELVPAWLRFLESRGLIDAGQHIAVRQELDVLLPAFHQITEGYIDDPILRDSLQTWDNESGEKSR